MNWRKSWKNAQKRARKQKEKNIIPPPDSSVYEWRQLSREDKIAYLNDQSGKLVIFRPQNYFTSIGPMMFISAIVGNGKYIQFKFLEGNTFREMTLDNDRITEFVPVMTEFR